MKEIEDRNAIFALICDKSKTIEEIAREIEIEKYIRCFEGNLVFNGSDSVVYGVNVRLNKNMNTFPFISTILAPGVCFDGKNVAERVDIGYSIPEFINKFSLKEITFIYEGGVIKVEKEEDIICDDLRENTLDKENFEKVILRYFTTAESGKQDKVPQSFLSENIKELQLNTKKPIYVWVSGEDRDISGDLLESTYLTNIMAITNSFSKLQAVKRKHEELIKFIMLLKSRRTFDADQERKKEAIKSAKAAIMSRNMSHNLGSHVMSYLKQKLGSVTSIMKEENKVLNELIPQTIKNDVKNYLKENYDIATSILDNIDKWEPTKIENVELPFLVGLGRFINYLQERQDYIATISTDYIPYGAPVNLKDAIYDELNPDLRYLRHKQERNNDAKNRPANILLNYIAKSEGLSRENMQDNFHSEKDIRIGFIDYSSNKPRIFGIAPQNDMQVFESKNKALTQMRKINFSLPGGLVGRQAVFSIIENLIRNAAKHGDTSKVVNLDFTFDVIDGSDIAWDIAHKNKTLKVNEWNNRVYDEKWRELYENASDLDEIFLLTITDNLPCNKEIVDNLKNGLYEEYVDSITCQMATANKGIKEVRISAAWLRGVTDEGNYLRYEDNSMSKKLAPLVAVEMSPERHLRYIICIRKNKTVAIVSRVKCKDKEGNDVVYSYDENTLRIFEKLREENKDRWSIVTEEELRKSKTSYTFIICPDDERAFNKLRPITSNRLCRWKVNKKSKQALAELDKDDQTLMYVYRLFTGLNDKNEIIFIEDDRAETANKDREHAENKQHFEKIQFVNIDNKEPIQYLYRTHHATEKEYKGFYTKYINEEEKYECVEGITGDNSSDRLIRREWLDEKWYYTHLYAMKKKVAIIDERIFRMVHNIDERLFVKDSNENIQTKELGNTIPGFSIENIKEQLVSFIDDDKLVEPIYMAKTINELAELVPEIPRNLVESKQVNNTVLGESHMTPYYHGKAVDIYTVVKSAEGDMILVGCTKTEFDAVKNKFNNNFEKMATFKRDTTGCIVLEPVSEYSSLLESHYDYISIHQGILDKIYENLDIKNKDEEKCQLTKCIHQRLMADKTTIGDYLPCFVIHSGRAKPTKEDMPQKQPFIQYAAIENAVKDCKPMLVELLDFAKYEPTNN